MARLSRSLSSSRSGPSGTDPADAEDPDWAPQLPSIWDSEDPDDDHLDIDDSSSDDPCNDDPYNEDPCDDDPSAPPIPMAARVPDWLEPRAWIAAERGAGRALAAAAEAVGRLDERLRRAPEALRLAWRERLVLDDISALLWAEGVRLRPETLALADADRIGRTEDESHVIARAGWAQRRLLWQGAVPTDGDGIAVFLGRVAALEASVEEDWRDVPEGLIPAGPDPDAAVAWCQALEDMEEVHPLTQSAAGFHLWRGLGLSGPGAWLEPGVIAAWLAGQGLRGGLVSAVLCAGSERALVRPGGDAAARLEA
ncbi:MAG: hypothetical protein AAFV09_16830 [Pseudomonadota bacterium]